MIIAPISFENTFKRSLQKRKNKPISSHNHDVEKEAKRLKKRLESIRSGYSNTPLTQKRAYSLEDQEILNLNANKRACFGTICPECHDIYRDNDAAQRQVVLYRPNHDNFDKKL
ncbi:MAG: hypothetical protein AB8B83_02155 [Bdellovibrionales bacterium]